MSSPLGPATPMADDEPMTSLGQINGVADRFFATIERADGEALAALWSDGAVVWGQDGGRDRDKTGGLKVIEWFVDATDDRRYEVLDRQFFAGGFLEQHDIHATAKDGTPLSFLACLVFKAGAGGLITRIEENLDPVDMAALTQAG